MTKVDTLGETLQRLARHVDGLLLDARSPAPSAELHTVRLLASQALLDLRDVEAAEARRARGRRLDRALRAMAAEFGESTGAAVDVRIHGDVRRVSHGAADVVLDLAQETFSNVSRAARSTVAVVVLRVDDERVSLDIADDGVDLPQRQIDAWGSTVELGLRRMARVATSVEGSLTVHPLRPRGLRVRAVMPVGVRGCP